MVGLSVANRVWEDGIGLMMVRPSRSIAPILGGLLHCCSGTPPSGR